MKDIKPEVHCAKHQFMHLHLALCPYCVIEALTPSAETKAAYSGEFFEKTEVPNPEFCGCGDCELCEGLSSWTSETYTVEVPVRWETIKAIMAAIRKQAGIE